MDFDDVYVVGKRNEIPFCMFWRQFPNRSHGSQGIDRQNQNELVKSMTLSKNSQFREGEGSVIKHFPLAALFLIVLGLAKCLYTEEVSLMH